MLERAIIAMPGSTLHLVEALTSEINDGPPEAPTNLLIDVERAHILRMLHASAWRIEGARGAALALGVKAEHASKSDAPARTASRPWQVSDGSVLRGGLSGCRCALEYGQPS